VHSGHLDFIQKLKFLKIKDEEWSYINIRTNMLFMLSQNQSVISQCRRMYNTFRYENEHKTNITI